VGDLTFPVGEAGLEDFKHVNGPAAVRGGKDHIRIHANFPSNSVGSGELRRLGRLRGCHSLLPVLDNRFRGIDDGCAS